MHDIGHGKYVRVDSSGKLVEVFTKEEPIKETWHDPVNKPAHYNKGKVEVIDSIESALGHQGFLDYCIGNVIKYVSRWRSKGGVEDLQKAQWYLNRAINHADFS